jgi:hypothetical protein
MIEKIHWLITTLILSLALFLATSAGAADKVVVIPLFDDCTCPPATAPTDPVPDQSPPRVNYNLEGAIVIDKVTRLVWQTSGSTTRIYANAEAFCQQLEPYEGLNRFRLPTVYELMTIVDYDGYHLFINNVFTNTSLSEYWTSTRSAANSENVWAINFGGGDVITIDDQTALQVRCVMGQTVNYGNFKDNDNGTVSDLATGLMWQQQELSSDMSWYDAMNYCSVLELGNHKDWHLPNIKELYSIVDTKLHTPALEHFAFPTIVGDLFWSATSNVDLMSNAYRISFIDGTVRQTAKETKHYVRCVRSQQ